MNFVAKAHGRVNLMGEHTDYNGGWVLPTAIPQFTEVTLARRAGKKVKVTASPDPSTGAIRELEYELGTEKPRGRWGDYIQGATRLLGIDEGFELTIRSTVPEGSGLSSSAALEISLLKALRAAFALEIPPLELARLGQRIENEFVGARVGIMDQVACALAVQGEALYLDTLRLEFERIRIPAGLELIVIDSGIVHRHSGGDYNRRRAECEEAARLMGLPSLRQVNSLATLGALPPKLARRVKHVFTENDRVRRSAEALRRGDGVLLGSIFLASHESMKNDYEVSLPEIDLMVDLLANSPGVLGARLTGGGFGGAVVALAGPKKAAAAAHRVSEEYRERTGTRATVLVAGAGP